MGIVVGFAPWILFWVLSSNNTFRIAIFASLLCAVIFNIPRVLQRNSKVLELGTLLFFAIIAVVSIFAETQWLERWINILGNAALMLIVLISIIISRPFTLQYAREQVPREEWDTPEFLSVNLSITWVWLATFFIKTVSSILTLYWPQQETWFTWIIPIGTFVAAIEFTAWYPHHMERKYRNSKYTMQSGEANY